MNIFFGYVDFVQKLGFNRIVFWNHLLETIFSAINDICYDHWTRKLTAFPATRFTFNKVRRNPKVNAGSPSVLDSFQVFGNTFKEKNHKDGGAGSTTRLNCVCRAFADKQRGDKRPRPCATGTCRRFNLHSFTRNSARQSVSPGSFLIVRAQRW